MNRPEYCTNSKVQSCHLCSLTNYGLDCHNHPVAHHPSVLSAEAAAEGTFLSTHIYGSINDYPRNAMGYLVALTKRNATVGWRSDSLDQIKRLAPDCAARIDAWITKYAPECAS